MGIDLSRLTSFTTSAKSLADLVLVSVNSQIGYQPQKSGELSVLNSAPKFLFNYEQENKVNLKSEITDHYIEDNTAINDQISLMPETITVQGFIGELNNIPPISLEPILNEAQEKLTLLSAFAPELTTAALRNYNQAFQAYQATKAVQEAGVASWGSISGSGKVNVINGSESSNDLEQLRSATANQTEQQKAFQMFYGYWRQRTLFTVQTPWAVFKNMCIENLTAIQGDTDDMSTFEVTFKLLRFASTTISQLADASLIDNTAYQGRAFDQGATEVDFGTSKPETSIGVSEVFS